MSRRLALIPIVLGVVAASRVAYASWAAIPLEQLVKDNAVIVVGKIERVEAAEPAKDPNQRPFDTAYIKVVKVLKNSLADVKIAEGDELPLSMPSAQGIAMSTDLRYPKGKEGVWILERKGKTYWATYPGDLQPLDKEKEIVALIEKQKS